MVATHDPSLHLNEVESFGRVGLNVVAGVVVMHLGRLVPKDVFDSEDRIDGEPFDAGGFLGAVFGAFGVVLGVEPALGEDEAGACDSRWANRDVAFLVQVSEPAVESPGEGFGAFAHLGGGEAGLLAGTFAVASSNARWSQ